MATPRTAARAAAVLVLATLLALAGCDEQRIAELEVGESTESDVRRQFGEPVTVVTQADGSRVFEYPRQPEGWTNYRITLGPDGRLDGIEQLLTEENFAKVRPGLAPHEVRALLGRPARTQRYDLKQQEVWDWRFRTGAGGQTSRLFSVTFGPEGRVVEAGFGDDPRETQVGGN